MTSFAERVKDLRQENNWTQAEIAKAFTVYMEKHKLPDDTKKHKYAPQHISDWENGTIPRGDTLQHLADFFVVTVPYLLGATNDRSGGLKDLAPQELQLISRLRENPVEASLVYRAYNIDPPTHSLPAGALALSEKAND
jgi:transcriptional regulator with XRE-family HTH domain